MFAVIKSGGKQYRVAKDDIVTVEKLLGEPGDTISLSPVLMLGDEGKTATIGAPAIEKAQVFAEVLEQSRSEKILIFKKQRRKNYRRKKGHRQAKTVLRILEVSPSGSRSKAAAKTTPSKKGAGAKTKPVAKSKSSVKKVAVKKEKTTKATSATKSKTSAKKPVPKKEATAENKPGAKKKAPAKKATPEKAKKNKE